MITDRDARWLSTTTEVWGSSVIVIIFAVSTSWTLSVVVTEKTIQVCVNYRKQSVFWDNQLESNTSMNVSILCRRIQRNIAKCISLKWKCQISTHIYMHRLCMHVWKNWDTLSILERCCPQQLFYMYTVRVRSVQLCECRHELIYIYSRYVWVDETVIRFCWYQRDTQYICMYNRI